MTAILRRMGSAMARIVDGSVPAAVAGESRLYSASGELFQRSGGGMKYKLTGPAATLPTDYVNGLGIQVGASGSKVDLLTGSCRSDDDTFDIYINANITNDINTSGVNGLDSGVVASSTYYYLWVIADSSGVNANATIMSLSATAPTVPAGYDKKRRVATARSGTAPNLLAFFQRVCGKRRRYSWNNGLASTANLQATVFTTISLLNNGCPPNAKNVVGEIRMEQHTTGNVADALFLRPTGWVNTTAWQFRRPSLVNASFICQAELPNPAGASFDYKVSRAVNIANLRVLGFDDEI